MVEINNKNYIVSLLITILGFVALASSTSYAILRGNTVSSNEQIINAGSVELQLVENFNNIDTGVSIMKDTDGLLQETTYDFTIKNIGSVPAKYDLKLLNTAPSGQTAISDDYIRVGLEVNGQEMGPMGLSNVSNIIDSNTINNNEIIKYKMRVWFDKNHATQIQNTTNKAYLSLKIEAKQSEYTPRVLYSFNNTDIQMGSTLSSISSMTTDYTALNKTYFLKYTMNSNEKIIASEVCYIINNNINCLKGYKGDGTTNSPYHDTNVQILKESFPSNTCSNGSTTYTCTSNGITAEANKNGNVRVYDNSNISCYVNTTGNSACNNV